ncbi:MULTISPECIES: nucleoside-binding protein [Pseudoalteromonas]|uniref:nucleoside-binding protein n=1 Tax=Pseudoalteromonas TaxID=53246 RepID=UPI0019D225E9|nr:MULTISPECIES: nucleoside-binding protein [Pseudoalteromonas]MBR8845952.1 nucleoside-binding protein [Pseudoalteromonas sp. JC3]UDM62005.1 nucleoside-binding protein [Pseudoalteromonas piscicida]WJE10323.1 nucleoside-binding protein [Pseudoalteromonas sp. JC3]
MKINTLIISSSLAFSTFSYAADWSTTQLHINHGDFKNPFSRNEATATVYSLQHASGYRYGDNFFFIDYSKDNLRDGYQDGDFYGEWYSSLSMSKVAGFKSSFDAIADVSLTMGFNAAGDAKVMKYLPGVKVNWNFDGFNFFSSTFTLYQDDSQGISHGGAPKESDSWMIDLAWGYPFTIGEQKFYLTGHVEYIGKRENELGNDVKGWLLAQPILQWDLGNAVGMPDNQLMLGVEWQYWRNKLGTDTNESVPQIHLAWTF